MNQPSRNDIFCEMALIDYLLQIHSGVKPEDVKIRATMADADFYLEALSQNESGGKEI
jgi:hypothetical protein